MKRKKETVYVLAIKDNGEPENKEMRGYTFSNTAHSITIDYLIIPDGKWWRVSEARTGMLLRVTDDKRSEVEKDNLEEIYPDVIAFTKYIKHINDMINMLYEYPQAEFEVQIY